MKILILGGDGMLGHQLLNSFKEKFEVKVTLRKNINEYTQYEIFTHDNCFDHVDVRDFEKLASVIETFKPNVLINAVGIVKQRKDSKEIIPSLEINALLPHKLSLECGKYNTKVIHISTDCVFSGKTGMYDEESLADADDIYGRTKFLGELSLNNCLTLRTSIIGRELSRHNSLLDWFLAQNEPIKGFKNAIFSGFTTIELARIIEMMILKYPEATGIYNVSSEPINKYDLLKMISELLNHKIEIVPDESFFCNRSLSSNLFRKSFNYTPPSWLSMLSELKKFTTK
jgi:dTDP-4-dehydrorhamnose reductase